MSVGSKMRLLFLLTVTVTVVSIVAGVYDASFCQGFIPKPDYTAQPGRLLSFFPDFKVNMETQKDEEPMTNSNVAISATLQTAITDYEDLHGEYAYTVNAASGFVAHLATNAPYCPDIPKNSFGGLGPFMQNVDGDWEITHLSQPGEAFGWDTSTTAELHEKVFAGYTTRRDIRTAKWYTCNYHKPKDLTLGIIWWISDSSKVTMPGGKQNTLVATEITNQNGEKYTTEYSLFESIAKTNLVSALQTPPWTVCDADFFRRQAPIPLLSKYFEFGAQETRTRVDQGETSKMVFMHFDTYDFERKIFIQTEVSKSSSLESGEEHKVTTIRDYNTGHTFQFTRVGQAECDVLDRILPGTSTISRAGGFQNMKTPEQFFHVDNEYKYSGVRLARGFECDTWSSQKEKATITWYFMTQKQKEAFTSDVERSPILVTYHAPQISSHSEIFYYRSNTLRLAPDMNYLSLCFGEPKRGVVARLDFEGDFTKDVAAVGVSKTGFLFQDAVMKTTGIGTPLRILDILVDYDRERPGYFNVDFRVLPRWTKGRDVEENADTVDTDDAMNKLRAAVDNGKFKFAGLASPDSPGMKLKAFSAVPGTLKVTDSEGRGQKQGGDQGIFISSDGYTSGAMAGLGICMLLAGIVLAGAGVSLFKRFYLRDGPSAQFSMSKLNKKAGE